MPKNLGDFLHDLLKKAGQNVEDKSIKDFLAGTVMTLEIPEDVAKGIDNNLLSVVDAKNNHQEIKNHYTKAALDAVDRIIEESVKDFPDAEKTEVLAEKSSYKRISLLNAKIKELEENKSTAAKGDKGELQKQIDQLHKDLLEKDKVITNTKKEFEGNILNYRVQSKIENLIANYKTTFDELDPSVKAATIQSLLNKELQDKDANLTFDDKDNFTLLKKDGSNYYGENHQQVDPASFVEQLLSRHKLLITTPKPGEKPPVVIQPKTGDGKDTGNPVLKTLAQESLNSYNKATAAVA